MFSLSILLSLSLFSISHTYLISSICFPSSWANTVQSRSHTKFKFPIPNFQTKWHPTFEIFADWVSTFSCTSPRAESQTLWRVCWRRQVHNGSMISTLLRGTFAGCSQRPLLREEEPQNCQICLCASCNDLAAQGCDLLSAINYESLGTLCSFQKAHVIHSLACLEGLEVRWTH